jgi:hypothetical protein
MTFGILASSSMTRSCGAGILVAVAMPAAPLPAADNAAQAFLRQTVGFTDAQIASIEAGQVVTKQLPAADKTEVVAFGAVRVQANEDAYLRRFRDLVRFRRTPSTLEIGRFSQPPTNGDVAGLSREDADFAAARACKPGDCGLKLSRGAIEKMQAEIQWSSPDARSRAITLMRQMLMEYVAAYQRGGTAQMATYHDKERPLDSSAEFKRLLEASPYLASYVPKFHAYVEAYPKGGLEGAEDLFYWAKDKNTPKPTVSAYHVTLWKDPTGPTVISIKQIYASHYIRVGLDLVALVPAPPGQAGFYLLDLYRAHIDPPGGILGGALLGKIRGGIESSVGESLKAAKTQTEAR